MDERPKAKLIKSEISNTAWWFNKYTFECVKCGEHFQRSRCDDRINPYCPKCKREIEAEKRNEYNMVKIRKGTLKMRKDNLIIFNYDYFMKNLEREYEYYKRIKEGSHGKDL